MSEQWVLVDPRDRAAFVEALNLARRVHLSVSGLQGLVDPVSTNLALAHALWEYAQVLVRRQEIQAVREGLLRQDHGGLPQESPVAGRLREQLNRTETLWQEIEAEARKHVGALSAAAEANERFIRERMAEHAVGEAVRWAEESLNRIAPVASSNLPLASEQLADETAEVLTAYRELMSRYGPPD
ncbi:MAG TPA: hypothetical protein VFX61_13155 [Micromonosporaceae bacterium]|nr:hypothetical protein [Micromonosporaceae bacterium]